MLHFSEIKNQIKNLGEYKSVSDIRNAGLRICRNTETGYYWLIEDEFLKPAVKSPRELDAIGIDPKRLRSKLLMCNKSKRALSNKSVLNYIVWGEQKGYQNRPTCASRNYWWNLGDRKAAEVNCNYLVDDRMRFYFTTDGIFVSDNFQELHNISKKETMISNVSLTVLFQEMLGRMPFGGGLLKIQTFEVKNILVMNPKYLASEQIDELNKYFEKYINKPIISLFEELGFSKPNADISNIDSDDISLDKVLPDRRVLDKVVFEAIGLTEDEQLKVYKAVVDLVKNRLLKARSV